MSGTSADCWLKLTRRLMLRKLDANTLSQVYGSFQIGGPVFWGYVRNLVILGPD